jgi:signal transduction histidine kinase
MMRVPFWLIVMMPLLLALLSFPAVEMVIDRQSLLIQSDARDSLARTTEALATSLAGDQRLAELINELPGSTYQSVHVSSELVLDGRSDDWPPSSPVLIGSDHLLERYDIYQAESLSYELRTGNNPDHLFLHLAIRDDSVVYLEANQMSIHRSDHVRLAWVNPVGVFHRYTIAMAQPGEIIAQEVSGTGRALRAETGIEGRWMATQPGYQLELQIDRALLGDRFSVLVADVDDSTSRDIRYLMGLTHTGSPDSLGSVVYAPSSLALLFSSLPFEVQLEDAAGELLISTFNEDETSRIMVRTAINDSERLLGWLTLAGPVEQPAFLWIRTLVALLLGMVMLGCIIAALLIRQRFTGLRQDLALEPENTPAGTGDAIERLASDVERQLSRMRSHNEYLEKMASRLNHELRTPVSVVKSSLENLQAEAMSSDSQIYVERATEGVKRLTSILNKMSEARRLEESLDEEEIIRFDLTELIRGCVAGYELAYRDHHFVLSIEDEEIPVTGIPEMMAQLMDKLVNNAVEFSTTPEIVIGVNVENGQAKLRVLNEGPELPVAAQGSLFESMVTLRDGKEGMHLGLGLYIARLIAEFHGARLEISNRKDVQGVMVILSMPLLRITSRLR